MKIIAEFNSTKEVQDFINAFGGKVTAPINIEGAKVGLVSTEKMSKPVKEEVKQEEVKQVNEVTEIKEDKVTRDQLHDALRALTKVNKGEEARGILKKYGVAKLTDLKEEYYAAALKEAEEIL